MCMLFYSLIVNYSRAECRELNDNVMCCASKVSLKAANGFGDSLTVVVQLHIDRELCVRRVRRTETKVRRAVILLTVADDQ
jgi:hypothetical protein